MNSIKVICTNNDLADLTVGKAYIAESTSHPSMFYVTNDKGVRSDYFVSRFEVME
jgi:hypothetical protein